jgi:hypothetical protein
MQELLNTILQAQGGGLVKQLAGQFGIDESQAGSALGQLLPALTGAAQNNVRQGGLDGLLGALSSGGHERYVEDPSLIGSPETIEDGNGILGHLLGSKDASRALASQVSGSTGLGVDVLKKMLPVVATLVMGSMSKATNQGSTSSGLLSMLDTNHDGSVLDDVAGFMGKFLKR